MSLFLYSLPPRIDAGAKINIAKSCVQWLPLALKSENVEKPAIIIAKT